MSSSFTGVLHIPAVLFMERIAFYELQGVSRSSSPPEMVEYVVEKFLGIIIVVFLVAVLLNDDTN